MADREYKEDEFTSVQDAVGYLELNSEAQEFRENKEKAASSVKAETEKPVELKKQKVEAKEINPSQRLTEIRKRMDEINAHQRTTRKGAPTAYEKQQRAEENEEFHRLAAEATELQKQIEAKAQPSIKEVFSEPAEAFKAPPRKTRKPYVPKQKVADTRTGKVRTIKGVGKTRRIKTGDII